MVTLDGKRVIRKNTELLSEELCWVDGADNLAKRERRTSTSIPDQALYLLLISDCYKAL